MQIHSPGLNCQKIVDDAAGYFVFLAVESLVDASSPKFFLPSAFSLFSWVLMKVSSDMSTRNLRFWSLGGRHSGAQLSSMVFSLSSMSCLRRLDILIFLFLSGTCGPSDLESSEKLTVSSELVEVVRYRPRLAQYLVFFLMIVFL
jgi:hypothetical protein